MADPSGTIRLAPLPDDPIRRTAAPMVRRHLPLTALRSFEAVGRCLSFARAAEVLGVTHGAVSRQITALEDMLGRQAVRARRAPGFHRGRRTAVRRRAAGLRPPLGGGRRVRRDESRAVLTVNAPPTFTMKWLIPRLSSFHRTNRDIEVRLSTGIGPPGELQMNKFDVVIRRLADPEADARSTPFLASTLLAVCAPELVERHPSQARKICSTCRSSRPPPRT